MKTFDDWKKEERAKFEDELNKVREMFMKELKEVTSKNSRLENVSGHFWFHVIQSSSLDYILHPNNFALRCKYGSW